MNKKETVLVFCAHSDDDIIGCGGTIYEYSQQGKHVVVVIFSYGENSSPWLKKHLVVEDRIQETQKIGTFIGSSEVLFLGLPDGKVQELSKTDEIKKEVTQLIKKYKPIKIFVHSKCDPHRDHTAVNALVLTVLDTLDPHKKIPTFTFEVWNVIQESNSPRLYVDISNSFSRKIQALYMFQSQKIYVYPLLIPVYYRAKISGWHLGVKYAERFYKVR